MTFVPPNRCKTLFPFWQNLHRMGHVVVPDGVGGWSARGLTEPKLASSLTRSSPF